MAVHDHQRQGHFGGEWAGADVAVWIPEVILLTGSTKKNGAAGPHPTRLGTLVG